MFRMKFKIGFEEYYRTVTSIDLCGAEAVLYFLNIDKIETLNIVDSEITFSNKEFNKKVSRLWFEEIHEIKNIEDVKRFLKTIDY